jgi:hypothetical protein
LIVKRRNDNNNHHHQKQSKKYSMSEYNQSHKQVKVIQQRKRTIMKTTMEHGHQSASKLTAVLPLNVQLVKIAEPT